MNLENLRCDHQCRNTCAMLTAALAQETMTFVSISKYLTQCDEPDVHDFCSAPSSKTGVHPSSASCKSSMRSKPALKQWTECSPAFNPDALQKNSLVKV